MSEPWRLEKSDLKRYPHFDSPISETDAMELATDPERVAKHKFFPFIRYTQRWTRFAEKGAKGKPKQRPIRYAARRDAYIYSRYRHILSEAYETELKRLGLDSNILAYRRILVEDGQGGKCNIHFAQDAFSRIRELSDCCVISLDISGYFESLDHARLKALWCRMLGVPYLSADHFRIFEAITKYAVVDKKVAYERLGYIGEKTTTKSGDPVNGYLTPYKNMPMQLCTGAEFREKLAGGGSQKSIIEKNFKPYGIPQGAPISDLLANLYLIDFDNIIAERIRGLGGSYYRYSDDIMIVVPGGVTVGQDIMMEVRSMIRDFGEKLVIKEEKSSLFVFRGDGSDQKFQVVHGDKGKDGIEFLGFRYDGKRIFLRDSTLSNLYRKVVRAARRDAEACVRRYPDKSIGELRPLFNYERLIARFGKVEKFGELHHEYRKWTFWTYAKRAAEIFGPVGQPILHQLKKYRSNVRRRANEELDRAVVRREQRNFVRAA